MPDKGWKNHQKDAESVDGAVLTVADVAERLGISYGRVLQKIHGMAIPHERIKGRIYARESALADLRSPWLRARREHARRLQALAAMPMRERLLADARLIASHARTRNVFRHEGLHTVADVALIPDWCWRYVPNCGKATIARIEMSLQAIGLRMGMSHADVAGLCDDREISTLAEAHAG